MFQAAWKSKKQTDLFAPNGAHDDLQANFVIVKQIRLLIKFCRLPEKELKRVGNKLPTLRRFCIFFRLPEKIYFLLPHGFGIANAIPINFAFKDFALAKSNPCGV